MYIKHFLARVSCLIIIPIGFYMAMFAIHFTCLVNPGDGDGFMSSEVSHLFPTFSDYSSNKHSISSEMTTHLLISRTAPQSQSDTYTLKSYALTLLPLTLQGGFLHSHTHMYPGGSNQQQITLYPHRDDNNVWILTNMTDPEIPVNASGTSLPLRQSQFTSDNSSNLY